MPLKDSILKSFKLSKPKPVASMVGAPLSMKTTPEIKRVDLQELEEDFYGNPLIFNGVNKQVQILMSTKRKIEAKDENVKKFFENFVDNIGFSGGEMSWDEWLEMTFRHEIVFGRAWTELIHNKKGNRIVDLDVIDPKKMDYVKKLGDKIALDEQGNPVGYVQTLPLLALADIEKRRKFKPPTKYGISLQSNQIFLPPERIAHFKLYTIGDGFYGIGLVEPIHITARSKNEMQAALVNAMWRAGFPTPVHYGGDVDHEPTPAQVKSNFDKLKKMNYKYGFAMPYYNKLVFLEAKHPEKLKEHLEYFDDQEITGLGMARAFITGSGEKGTNRAILTRQEHIMKLTLRDILKRTFSNIRAKIFHPIAELEGFKETPKLTSGEVVLQELDSKASRLAAYAKAGLLSPDPKFEEYIRKMEDLPKREPEEETPEEEIPEVEEVPEE